MALRNGIFVHSLDHWAAAIRTADGELRLASGRKPELPAGLLAVPGFRGVLRMAEMGYLLPIMRRRLPEARLPVEGAGSAAALGATVVVSRAIRGSRLSPLTAELLGASLALVPAMASLHGSQVAGYHGAEHKAIGGYEHGQAAEQATKEHDRCGSHMVGPMLAATVVGNVLVNRLPASRRGPAGRRGGCDRCRHRGVRLDDPPPRQPGLARPAVARLRAAAGRGHARADRTGARGGAGRAARGAAAGGRRAANRLAAGFCRPCNTR